ncbi:MAG: DUF1963 domain-containing protein [Bacteroidota bacterium]
MEPYRKSIEQFEDKEEPLRKVYNAITQSLGHKMGGYGFIVQEDPSTYYKAYKDYILLLQIAAEGEIGWKDSGTAQFFYR